MAGSPPYLTDKPPGPYSIEMQPCNYCSKSWVDLKPGARSTIKPHEYMRKIKQVSKHRAKTTVSWLCPFCYEALKRDIEQQNKILSSFLAGKEEIQTYEIVLEE